MDPQHAQKIGRTINTLRPDWPTPSLITLIQQKHSHRSPQEVLIALTVVAVDPDTKTPARINAHGKWWEAAAIGTGLTLAEAKTITDDPKARWAEKQRQRIEGAKTCGRCDHQGVLPSGAYCDHRSPEAIKAEREAANLVKQQVHATIHQLKAHTAPDSDDSPPGSAA